MFNFRALIVRSLFEIIFAPKAFVSMIFDSKKLIYIGFKQLLHENQSTL